MKKAFIIRGFRLGATAADPDFESVRTIVRQCGYEPVQVPFTWNYKTLSDYTDKFVDFYVKNTGRHNIVVGHSFGAMVALAAASRLQPDLIVLCSLSGYFKEDLGKYSDDDWIIKHMGKRRRIDFERLSAISLAQGVRKRDIPSIMLYGELEKELFPVLYSRVRQTASVLKPCRLIQIPKADHSIRGAAYLDGLRSALQYDLV